MLNDRRNTNNGNSILDLYSTYREIQNDLLQSTNKNSAVRQISQIKLGNSDVSIGTKTASQIYDKYTEYTGGTRRR